MNDTPRRFGSDFDSLRGTPAAPGRGDVYGDDPLAELARLVSQSDPRQQHASRHDDYDRAYGATSNPDYDPDDLYAEQLRGGGHDDFDDRYQPYDETQYDGEEHVYPGEDEDRGSLRRPGGLTIAAVLAVAVIGGGGAWAYYSFSGGGNSSNGAPPVIQAATEPAKTVPEGSAKDVPHQNKLIYDRVGAEPSGNAVVVNGAEEPVERPAATRPQPSRVIPLPGTQQAAEPPDATANDTPQTADNGTTDDSQNGARMVRTITIRPPGAPAAPQVAPAPAPVQQQQAYAEPEQPAEPQPIVGTGPAAEGMSMSPGREFGIMASDTQSAAAPQAQPRTTSQVPVPPARPAGLPVRTATVQPIAPVAPPVATQPRPTATAPAALTPPRPVQQQQVATAAVPSGPAGAFAVQVTSQRSEAEARAAFSSLQQRYPQILGGYQPSLQPVTLPDRGTFYRVRIATRSQADATNLCNNLKAAGGDCIVQRN